jgi:hypothetical protein
MREPLTIESYEIRVNWSDGTTEVLDNVPYIKSLDIIFDSLEEERNETYDDYELELEDERT